MGNVFDLSINKEMKDNFARATVYRQAQVPGLLGQVLLQRRLQRQQLAVYGQCAGFLSISPVSWRRSAWNAPL